MPEAHRLTRLTRIEARLVAYDWPWARENVGVIEDNWRLRKARSPAMFDGPVLLSCACAVGEGTCRIDLFETTFSRFIAYCDIAHRDRSTFDGRVANAFAAIVPWTADGAVLVGEMGAHTANAGQLYFPCGTPDRDDVRGACVDLAGSAARELFEETGLALPPDAAHAWILLEGEGRLAFLRPVKFPESAAALCRRIEKHRLGETEPELAGLRVVRGAGDIDAGRTPGFVRAYLADAFGASAAG